MWLFPIHRSYSFFRFRCRHKRILRDVSWGLYKYVLPILLRWSPLYMLFNVSCWLKLLFAQLEWFHEGSNFSILPVITGNELKSKYLPFFTYVLNRSAFVATASSQSYKHLILFPIFLHSSVIIFELSGGRVIAFYWYVLMRKNKKETWLITNRHLPDSYNFITFDDSKL